MGRDFVARMRESQFYLGDKGTAKPLDVDWRRFPKELRPGGLKKKRKGEKPNLIKRQKVNVEEKNAGSEDEEEKDENANSDDGRKEEVESEEEEDEEMDGGTDYANNYFDNGEGFLDEDEDNLDEGGIY